jgi:hypothetical protein
MKTMGLHNRRQKAFADNGKAQEAWVSSVQRGLCGLVGRCKALQDAVLPIPKPALRPQRAQWYSASISLA